MRCFRALGLLGLPVTLLGALGVACASPAVRSVKTAVADTPRTPVAVRMPVPPAARDAAGAVQDPIDPPVGVALPSTVLVPGTAEDAVVVKVGERELRKSHVFDRLATIRPLLATQVVDLLVLDLLVAEHAAAHDIQLAAEEVEDLVRREVDLVRQGVTAQLGANTSLEAYVRVNFSMELEDFRHLLRLRIAQRLYHDYVIRFMALREPRVRVRFIVNRDAGLMREIAQKVSEGADFGSLALQHSEDESRRANGLLPPFGPSFDHPIASAAFSLQAGELSPVFTLEGADGPRHYLVYCLEQIPDRPDAVFGDVREEIRASLKETPRSDFEGSAYVRRHSDRLERMGGVEIQPRSVLNKGDSKR